MGGYGGELKGESRFQYGRIQGNKWPSEDKKVKDAGKTSQGITRRKKKGKTCL